MISIEAQVPSVEKLKRYAEEKLLEVCLKIGMAGKELYLQMISGTNL